jgi:hypothetical protein
MFHINLAIECNLAGINRNGLRGIQIFKKTPQRMIKFKFADREVHVINMKIAAD